MDSKSLLDVLLQRALDENKLLLHYQPQIGSDRSLAGVEALARVVGPEGQIVSAGDFIRHAEDTGFILPLGRCVLSLACAQVALWATDPRFSGLTVSVNISAIELCEPGFAQSALDIVKDAGVEVRKLVFEITETKRIGNRAVATENAMTLHKQGVPLWLDNFGSGYNSLDPLKWLPLEGMKISRHFFRDVPADLEDVATVSAIMAMCRTLNVLCGATGIETQQALDWAASAGFARLQGNFIGTPMAP